jgi:hypothetical protein
MDCLQFQLSTLAASVLEQQQGTVACWGHQQSVSPSHFHFSVSRELFLVTSVLRVVGLYHNIWIKVS